MNKPLRIVFAGSTEFSAALLQALLDSYKNIIHVLTQPDKPAGRGRHTQATAVKLSAVQHSIPVSTPLNLKDLEIQKHLQDLNADLMILVAYGLLIPQNILSMIPNCINVHPSLLPRWRGATPIESPLLAGDTLSGVTIMEMVSRLDAGPILKQQSLVLDKQETRESLYQRLLPLSIDLLLETVQDIENASLQKTAQDENLATYALKWTHEDLRLDWSHSSEDLERRIRAFAPSPGAYTELKGSSIKILQASPDNLESEISAVPGQILKANAQGVWVQTAQGILRIEKIQISGKKPMLIRDAFNGYSQWFTLGSIFNT